MPWEPVHACTRHVLTIDIDVMYPVVLVWTSNRGRELSSAEKHMVVLDVVSCASQGC